MSFPVNLVDDADDADGDLPAGASGCECEPVAFVCHVSIRVAVSGPSRGVVVARPVTFPFVLSLMSCTQCLVALGKQY